MELSLVHFILLALFIFVASLATYRFQRRQDSLTREEQEHLDRRVMERRLKKLKSRETKPKKEDVKDVKSRVNAKSNLGCTGNISFPWKRQLIALHTDRKNNGNDLDTSLFPTVPKGVPGI